MDSNKIRLFVTALLLGIAGLAAFAQARTVRGQVLDTHDEPVVGATVAAVGASVATVSGLDGNFRFEVPDQSSELQISYIGYRSVTCKIPADGAPLRIVIEEDAMLLNDVVVVGYGTQKKVNLTGAVSSVSSKDLENRTAHTVAGMLQGAVPGLNVTTSSGVPGSSPSLNVRGQTSINATSPLVLIDGAEGDLNRVNPNDVESISVIKDASAAAIYGARAAFGVVLVTTKSGQTVDGKATVRYSGRIGWEEPTTSTDFIDTGYWSAYIVNTFWKARYGTNYIDYTDEDMMQLWARVNDKTENPERPWVVEEERNGRKQWVYYGNYDWYHMMFQDRHLSQQHNVSLSGGSEAVKYFVSGGLDFQDGVMKINTDKFKKYNLRSKLDFKINRWANFANNTSFYGSTYAFQGDGSVENTFAYVSRHALACFPMQNPDGSYVYKTPYLGTYNVGNGRHILAMNGSHRNVDRVTDFANTSRLTIFPIRQLTITGDFTYRFNQSRSTSRSNRIPYRVYPDSEIEYYDSGAGENVLDETFNTRNYYSVNAFASYNDTFAEAHSLSAVFGYNYETLNIKKVGAYGKNLSSDALDDFNLVGPNDKGETLTGVSGSQNEYALSGIFGRVNYNYKGRYLFEASGRYDGTSRFAKGARWGFFPSASAGWRISEENFMSGARSVIDNLKLRLSYGSLGNQNVSSYYAYLRLVSIKTFDSYTFGEGTSKAQYASLGAPVASDLTWETSRQWNLGLDYSMLNGRFSFTGDLYVRDTDNMLTDGLELPSVYGATEPQMNCADMRTRGYELAISWRDNVTIFDRPLVYSVSANLSDYRSTITRFDNKDKIFAKKYYEGMEMGEIWGFMTDGLFRTEEEAQAWASQVDLGMISTFSTGWHAGDLKFLDIDGDGKLSKGADSAIDPGDRVRLGNSLPRLSYGFNVSLNYAGFDASAFFQGTGNHYWYPNSESMAFWGVYDRPYVTFIPENFMDQVWSEDNPDAYFPRPLAYSAYSGALSHINDRYLQNIRYLRFKNLTVGYTLPQHITSKIGVDKLRVYFTGENLCYWSPIKKHSRYVDPEAAINRDNAAFNNAFYPWAKSYMFGIDLSF